MMSDISADGALRRRQYIRQRMVRQVVRLVPMCLLLGGAMEMFMVHTGFYDVVKRKEAERIIEKRNAT